MDKEVVVYILQYTMEYYSALKKKNILSFVTMWMKQEDIMLNKISQTQKDKYYMISLMDRIKKKLNL